MENIPIFVWQINSSIRMKLMLTLYYDVFSYSSFVLSQANSWKPLEDGKVSLQWDFLFGGQCLPAVMAEFVLFAWAEKGVEGDVWGDSAELFLVQWSLAAKWNGISGCLLCCALCTAGAAFDTLELSLAPVLNFLHFTGVPSSRVTVTRACASPAHGHLRGWTELSFWTHFSKGWKVWSSTFGSFLSCYNFVPNEIWQHNSCSNYSNWLQRVQDDHVISCFMGERSPPSPYFHASVVFKGVLQRTVKQSTSTWVLNTAHKGWLVNLETKSNCRKKKHIAFFPS